MAHLFRFIGERVGDKTWRLIGDEAYHVAKVLRLAEGANVEVTDGRGAVATGALQSVKAAEVMIAVDSETYQPAPAGLFTFAVGALKPGAIDEILPSLTELGVDQIWVFHQQESAKSRMTDKATERWHRIVAQSVKQCKRAWLPELRTFESLAQLMAEVDRRAVAVRIVLSANAKVALSKLVSDRPEQATIVVAGGEKGLSPGEEKAFAAAGYQEASLGPYVLRAVTAAVAAAAVMASVRE